MKAHRNCLYICNVQPKKTFETAVKGKKTRQSALPASAFPPDISRGQQSCLSENQQQKMSRCNFVRVGGKTNLQPLVRHILSHAGEKLQ